MNDSTEFQKAVNEAAAKSTVQVLTRLGFDLENPLEVQKDMAHLREQRKTSEAVKKHIRLTLYGSAIIGLFTLVIVGVKEYLK